MRRILAVLGAIGLGCTALTGCVASPPPLAAFTPPAPPPSPTAAAPSLDARMLTEARHFVYRVRSVACLAVGSSFSTSSGIITNRHVAQGSAIVQLATWSGDDFQADVDALSPGPDLAELTADREGLPDAPIDTTRVAAGTPVWVAGYPEGDQLTVTHGVAVGYVDARWIGQPEKVLEITAAVRHGNSGGPVLDADGKVIAVVFAISPKNGDGLAIPASAVARFERAPGALTDVGCLE